MPRKILIGILVLGLVFSVFCVSIFAEDETFTITTYYPSPYGSYNELQTNKFVVGDANGDGSLTSADQPPENGQIKVARSIIYKPVNKDGLTNRQEGELVYNASDDILYLYNGSKWVAQGGAAGNVLYLACPWGSDRNHSNAGWGDQCGANGLICCTPASCPSGWTSVATFAEVISVACGNADCLWNSYPYYSGNVAAAGRTVRVCVKD